MQRNAIIWFVPVRLSVCPSALLIDILCVCLFVCLFFFLIHTVHEFGNKHDHAYTAVPNWCFGLHPRQSTKGRESMAKNCNTKSPPPHLSLNTFANPYFTQIISNTLPTDAWLGELGFKWPWGSVRTIHQPIHSPRQYHRYVNNFVPLERNCSIVGWGFSLI